MNEPSKNQLKELLLSELTEYIYEEWAKGHNVTGIKIDEKKTFSDSFAETFYEKEEYGVDSERARIPHTYGVLWAVEDLDITIGSNLEDSGKVTLFSRAYRNDTSDSINVSEKLEEVFKVTDTTTISFTEKINAGYEASVTAGVKVGPLNLSATAAFSMGIELGVNQTKTQTVEKVTTAGFAMNFTVPAGKKKNIVITACKKASRMLNDAHFAARGKAYVQVAYNGEDLGNAHTYIIDLKEAAQKGKFKFIYPISYIVEGVEHSGYTVTISESDIDSGTDAKEIAVTSYPLEVAVCGYRMKG